MKTTCLLSLLLFLLVTKSGQAQSTECYTDLASAIKNSEKVRVLDLSHRELQSVPDTFEIFTNLEELRLGFNNLEQLPKSLAGLENLTSVNLTGNINLDIEQTISVLSTVKNLENLNLSNCGIMFMPSAIARCDSLKTLVLKSNQLLFLPNSIGGLSALKTLNLNSNYLSNLPPSFIQLQNLSVLHLEENEYLNVEVAMDIVSKIKLEELHLKNQLITCGFNHLDSLKQLSLVNCRFHKTPSFSKTEIEELHVSNCNGYNADSLILSLAQTASLHSFYLIDDTISSINLKPLLISKISSLKLELPKIYDLNRTIYPLAKMPELSSLDLSDNNFTELPKSLNRCENLTHLNLSQNNIGQSILSLKNQNIQYLNLRFNEIEESDVYALMENWPEYKVQHDFMYKQPVAKQIPHPDFKPKVENFEWQGEEPKLVVLQSGTKLDIPEKAFVTMLGDPVSGNVSLNVEEFKTVEEIFASGIPMTYDSAGTTYDFKSGGMMEIRAFQNGQELALAPTKAIEVEMITKSNENFNVYNLNDTTGKWTVPSSVAVPSTNLVRTDTSFQLLDSLTWYNANSPWHFPSKEIVTFNVKRYPKLNSFLISVDKRNRSKYTRADKEYPETSLLADHKLIYEGQNKDEDFLLLQTILDTVDRYYGYSRSDYYPVHKNRVGFTTEVISDFYLRENPKSDNFILTVIFKGESLEFPVALNHSSKNPKSIQKQYTKFYTRYKRGQNKRLANWYETDSISELNRRLRLEQQWQALTANSVMRNGQMYIARPTLGFMIGGLGIVNCDVPLPKIPENPKVLARATFKSIDNQKIKKPTMTYVLDYTNNAAYRYRSGAAPSLYKNSYSVIVIDLPNSQNMGLVRFNQIKDALDKGIRRPIFEYEEFESMDALTISLQDQTVSID